VAPGRHRRLRFDGTGRLRALRGRVHRRRPHPAAGGGVHDRGRRALRHVLGTVIAWGSATVTAALAFFAARTALRERVERLAEKNKWLKAINRALPKEGWKVVALARLSPLLPFGVQNYFFGVTKVHRRDYLLATAIAILPGTVVYAFLGSTGRALMGGGDPLKWTMLAIGIIASIALTIFLGRLAKKRLGIDG
jgi:uncharacterized membrane protein YdjX (TVP38/TMEM64 family)